MSALRTFARSAFVRVAARPAFIAPRAALRFTATPLRTFASAKAEPSLVDKLAEEIEHESKNAPSASKVQAFLKGSSFAIADEPGKRYVYLTRTYGNEDIKIRFAGQTVFSENEVEDGENEQEGSTEARDITVFITKKDGNGQALGSLVIDVETVDSQLAVRRVQATKDTTTALAETSEAETKLYQQYEGPEFEDLDPQLIDSFYDYLADRKIDDNLAAFIEDYAILKEHKEYTRWLNLVKELVQ